MKLVGDLYRLSKDNRVFIESWFLAGEDPLEHYKGIIADALYPDVFKNKPIRLSVGKKAISDYRTATNDEAGTLELSECRYLVKDFGTSLSPKSTRLRDSLYCPGRPASVPLRHTIASSVQAPQHSHNGLTACRMSLQIFSAATGNTPLRHYENPPGPTPTGDYQPSLRSPWLAAMVHYLEQGNEFTAEYGDIDEQFYASLETMLDRILEALVGQTNDIQDQYVPRLEQVVLRASGIGWGYHDYISDRLEEFLDGLDES
jgi:hypothetical protein